MHFDLRPPMNLSTSILRGSRSVLWPCKKNVLHFRWQARDSLRFWHVLYGLFFVFFFSWLWRRFLHLGEWDRPFVPVQRCYVLDFLLFILLRRWCYFVDFVSRREYVNDDTLLPFFSRSYGCDAASFIWGGGFGGGGGGGIITSFRSRPTMLRSWLSSLYFITSMMLRAWLSSVYVHTSVMLRAWLSSVYVQTNTAATERS